MAPSDREREHSPARFARPHPGQSAPGARPQYRRAGERGRPGRGRRLLLAAIVAIAAGLALATLMPGLSGWVTAGRVRDRVQAVRPPATTALPLAESPAAASAPRAPRGRVSLEDGLLPQPVSPFDLEVPAIARLDPDLLGAVQHAAADAAADGVSFVMTSGWRSPAYQQQLLDEAVAQYGSLEEARRFVATPETSAHVTGRAVDIGPAAADNWLSRHGAGYGLCQTYANEMWHFELATVPGGECPAMLPDASP